MGVWLVRGKWRYGKASGSSSRHTIENVIGNRNNTSLHEFVVNHSYFLLLLLELLLEPLNLLVC